MFALAVFVVLVSITAAAALLLGHVVLDTAVSVLKWLLAAAPFAFAVLGCFAAGAALSRWRCGSWEWVWGTMKDAKWLFVPIVLPAALFYADLATDLGALQVFWESGERQYFSLNVLFIVGSCLWGARLASNVVTHLKSKLLVAALGLLQLLPAACLAASAFYLVLSRFLASTPGEASSGLRRVLSSGFPLARLLGASGFAESMLEARRGSSIFALSKC
jgi:hypothetical protein